MEYLEISGVNLSSYIKSLVITHEPVWSTNAGRTLDATFVGDIVARKWKIEVTTKPLTQQESALIQGLIEVSPFFNVSFIPTNSSIDALKTISVYTGTPSHTLYSYNKNLIRYQGMSFNLIEQ